MDLVPDLLDEEWQRSQTPQPQEIEKLLGEPLIMVPVIDEKNGKGKVPQSLLLQVKDVDIVRTRIRNLFTLRSMLLLLTRNDGES